MTATTPEGAFLATLYARAATYAPRHPDRDALASVVRCLDALGDPGHTPAYRAACADCAAELLSAVAPDLLPAFLALTFPGAA